MTVARREHPAQQTEYQNQMLLERARIADAGMKQFAPDDFNQRQKHQYPQRDGDQQTFAIPQKPPNSCGRGSGRGELMRVGDARLHYLPSPARLARNSFRSVMT